MSSGSEGCRCATGLPCLEHPSIPSTSSHSQHTQRNTHPDLLFSSNFGSTTLNWPPDGPQLLSEYIHPVVPPLTGPARNPGATQRQINSAAPAINGRKRSHLASEAMATDSSRPLEPLAKKQRRNAIPLGTSNANILFTQNPTTSGPEVVNPLAPVANSQQPTQHRVTSTTNPPSEPQTTASVKTGRPSATATDVWYFIQPLDSKEQPPALVLMKARGLRRNQKRHSIKLWGADYVCKLALPSSSCI
jgi:hypothetical protein